MCLGSNKQRALREIKSLTKCCNTRTACAGQFVSRGFVVLLRKSNPQNLNLQTALEHGVRYLQVPMVENFGARHQESLQNKCAAESVVERVYLAVEQLCTGQGDVRDRLQIAIVTLLPLQSREFPEHLRSDFEWVLKESTKYKSEYPQFRGDLEATMRRIRNSTGQKIAQKIFHIYSAIQDIRGFPLLEYRDPNE